MKIATKEAKEAKSNLKTLGMEFLDAVEKEAPDKEQLEILAIQYMANALAYIVEIRQQLLNNVSYMVKSIGGRFTDAKPSEAFTDMLFIYMRFGTTTLTEADKKLLDSIEQKHIRNEANTNTNGTC